MEQYTDDERVEDLKKWWSENGLSLMVGIVLGIAAIFGWRYWNSYRDNQAEQASLTYDAFVKAVEKPDAEQARQRGQGLLAEFPNSAYAALTTLRLAKLAVDDGDNATAIQRLQWVIDHAKLAELQDIARFRLARVLFAVGQLKDAEKQLDNITTSSLTAELEELRGDLYLAGKDVEKARTAYATALAAGGTNRILQIKLNNLTAPTAETVIAAPKPPPPVTEAPPAPAPETVPVGESAPEEPAVTKEQAPVEPTPEPVATEPTSVEATPEPVATEPTSVEAAPEPVATESTPIEPIPEPVPVEATLEPAVTEPASIEPAPIESTPEPAPVEATPEPAPPASPTSPSGPSS
ncbi:MAG: tetratricopeptide repeat protein [Candidatus Competibacteraceae bacterium]|nr:tetratricopeptide repeat protein [Candidatus Competibacteraceae bacterium]MCP5126191.1 tetratricopeptide repeat protein [Gammaproteobacteria bacterium]HRX71935.1 tetratricopeptide repeat protein [Candidatus Competibacteraceae bacterium]